MDLSSNKVKGSVPSSFGGLSNLQYLYLYGTDLTGIMPSEVCTMSSADMRVDCPELLCECCKNAAGSKKCVTRID
jgi:hypothetical protein